MFAIGAPPREASILHSQSEIQKHSHESQSSIQRRRQHIIISLPPFFSVPKNEEIEDNSNDNPAIEVDGGGRWHDGGGAQEDGEVNEGDPLVIRESLLKKPNQERANCAADEEPVEGGVITERAEDSFGANEAPNY